MRARSRMSPYRGNILKCRARARKCRLDAENARIGPEKEAWLDFAEDWDKLADAFELEACEQDDEPKFLQ